MPTLTPQTRATPLAPTTARGGRLPRGTALLRGLLGWLVLWVGLGVSIGVVAVLQQRFGLSGAPSFLLQAALMTGLVVPTILVLRARLDRRSRSTLGWSRQVGRPLALGLGVGVLSGLLAWTPALLAGWIRLDSVDLPAFAWFLVVNGLALMFFEALPEELALRGYTWTNLRDGWGTLAATVLTTLLFPLGGIVDSAVAAGITTAFGTSTSPVTAFPADPVLHVVQLTLFGLTLVAARRVPIRGALFVAVAFHWTQLCFTRTLTNGMNWVDSGWRVTFVQPDALALVWVHIVLAGLLFVVTRKLFERSASSRDGDRA